MFERASFERELVSCGNYMELGCTNPGLWPRTERLQVLHSTWSTTPQPHSTWAESHHWHSAGEGLVVVICQQPPESGQLFQVDFLSRGLLTAPWCPWMPSRNCASRALCASLEWAQAAASSELAGSLLSFPLWFSALMWMCGDGWFRASLTPVPICSGFAPSRWLSLLHSGQKPLWGLHFPAILGKVSKSSLRWWQQWQHKFSVNPFYPVEINFDS